MREFEVGDVVRRTADHVAECKAWGIGLEGLEAVGQVRGVFTEYLVVKWEGKDEATRVKKSLVERAYE